MKDKFSTEVDTMKIHRNKIITSNVWPSGRQDPDQVIVDAISNSSNIILCKSCDKEFDSDGLVYCKECRLAPGMAYNNYDIEDL
jgi:hypothetical protein